MYPEPSLSFIEVPELSRHLCGQFRPGHFRGVATVVAKLFHIVQPDLAFFGEKDAQQLAIIERMVEDLNFPIRIVPVPTVREPDGLALSSRNERLSPAERRIAPLLYQALLRARCAVAGGEREAEIVKREALNVLAAEPSIRPEYFEIVDPRTMQPVERVTGAVRICAAAWLGSTRLIDNVLCPDPA
jgi:pantoate--beta-alanine ligase